MKIKVTPNWQNHIRLEFSSGNPDNDHPEPGITIAFWKWYIQINCWMPFKPIEKKVKATFWDAATIERMGRDWYINYTERRYGFYVCDGHFNVNYGRYTHDSSTEQRWSMFLPWTQWRHVRHTMYNIDGSVFFEELEDKKGQKKDWMEWHQARDNLPKVCFRFADYDGEIIEVETFAEERQWKFGTGWFKWLSWFRKDLVKRSLDLDFTKEVGKRKGSWKGGTLGHSVDLGPNELYETAFKRYCKEHNLTYLQMIPAVSDLSRKKWRKQESNLEACAADGGASAQVKKG